MSHTHRAKCREMFPSVFDLICHPRDVTSTLSSFMPQMLQIWSLRKIKYSKIPIYCLCQVPTFLLLYPMKYAARIKLQCGKSQSCKVCLLQL